MTSPLRSIADRIWAFTKCFDSAPWVDELKAFAEELHGRAAAEEAHARVSSPLQTTPSTTEDQTTGKMTRFLFIGTHKVFAINPDHVVSALESKQKTGDLHGPGVEHRTVLRLSDGTQFCVHLEITALLLALETPDGRHLDCQISNWVPVSR